MSDTFYAIIEIEDGMTVIEYGPADDVEAAALARQGTVVDPGPFLSYDEAYDELLSLEANEDDEWIE